MSRISHDLSRLRQYSCLPIAFLCGKCQKRWQEYKYIYIFFLVFQTRVNVPRLERITAFANNFFTAVLMAKDQTDAFLHSVAMLRRQ